MLVGRSKEVARAVAAMADGDSLIIAGEAGAGKSALLSEALAVSGRRVRSGQCFRSLAWMSGLPLQQALGSVLSTGDPSWTAHWVVRSCARAVLHLDDLQWADPLTLTVLGLLPRSTTFVATVRTGDPGTEAALQAARSANASILELDGLGPDDATTLAMQRHPHLRSAEAKALALRCAGNPLLIEELGADAEPTLTLRRSVTARLRRLGDEAWVGFALLALAGEPLPESQLPETNALVASGFAVLSHGSVQPRHPLLADVVRAELEQGSPEQRRGLERQLARRAEHGGQLALAARASAAGGERDQALQLALRALEQTDQPGERASLLHLAATCADAARAVELATRAVDELVTAGDYAHAATLLEQLPENRGARWSSLIGRVRWQLGDDSGALAAFEAGLTLAQPGTCDSVLLQVERARAVLLGLGDAARGLELAREAHAEATATGFERARAVSVLGTAEYYSGIADDVDHLAQALEWAAIDGDLMTEFTSANNLIAVHESAGRTADALALAARFAARAQDLHMREWQVQMQAMALNAQMHAGDYDSVVAEVPPLLAEALDRRTRDQLQVTLNLTLVDLGRHEAAMAGLQSALESSAAEFMGRGYLLWIRAEAHLWAGDPAHARDDALAALELAPADYQRLFPLLTLAHARLLLGEPVEAQPWPTPPIPLLEGARPELEGLVASSAADAATAVESFQRAALAWAGQHRRGELRCRWLAADLNPDPAAARRELLALEHELSQAGMAPLLARVKRSLRARGVRSAAPRGRVGEVTAREREVLDLVAKGLSTEAIAARLGLAPSTVAAHIASARARLGAATRWQALSG